MTNFTATSAKHLIERTPARSRVESTLLALVHYYQRSRSGRLSPCRFYPSCSNYALEAIEIHGARHGAWLTLRRLLRCRPLGPKGIDLVPLPTSARSSSSCTR